MTLKLNKQENAQALHIQLMTYFRERILDGRLPVGTRLPTEVELAREHQISRDTVRLALSQLVDEGLLERKPRRGTFVQRAQPSPTSTSRTNNQTDQKRIGVVLNRPPAAQLNMDILIGIEQAAKSHGYHVSFTYAEENQEQQARDIKRLHEDHILGLVIFPVTNTTYDESIWHLHEEHFPFVLIDRYFPDLLTDYVGPDNFGGGYRATEHLLILGHTRIAFVSSYTETVTTTSVRDRWKGYCAALNHYGIPYDASLLVPETIMREEELRDYYRTLLRKPDRPTAIFAVNDMTALGMLDLAAECGLRVPEDLALVGFDNLTLAAHVTPALTTILHPAMDVGFKAGTQLINRIEGQSGPSRHIELPTTLIVRASCGAQLRIKKGTALPE